MMARLFGCLLLAATMLCAQPFRWTREQMIHFTPENPFERFPDGRPKVPDELLEKVKGALRGGVLGQRGKKRASPLRDHATGTRRTQADDRTDDWRLRRR